MKLVHLGLFITISSSAQVCLPDKTFVYFQPILHEITKAPDDSRFKHTDKEDLTDEAYRKFEAEVRALFEQWNQRVLKTEKKIPVLANLSNKWEVRSESVRAVNDVDHALDDVYEKVSEKVKEKLQQFRKKYHDQLGQPGSAYLSFGRFDHIINSLNKLDAGVAAIEPKYKELGDVLEGCRMAVFGKVHKTPCAIKPTPTPNAR